MDAALDIPTSKVRVVVTGSGSNMVAAFRTYLASCSEEDNKEDDLEVDDSGKVSHENDLGKCEDQAFESIRIGCFVHILQLVTLKSDQYVGFQDLLKHTHMLIRKLSSSTKLQNVCGKNLSRIVPHGVASLFWWSSVFSMYKNPWLRYYKM